jgi:hypothetical protein
VAITAVCPLEGRERLLAIQTDQIVPVFKWALFVTNTTPIVSGTTLASLTEATFNGYARQTYTPGAVTDDGSGHATEVDTPVSFVAGSSISGLQSVYVAALIDTTSPARLIFGWNPTGSPVQFQNPGDTYSISPSEFLGAMA